MKVTFVADATSPSVLITDPGSHWQTQAWHAYVTAVGGGTFGGGAVQIQYSPDGASVPDSASRWFAPTALAFSVGGDTWFQARFRKMRAVMTGSTSPNVVVEVV